MDHLGISQDAIREGLASFEGIKRRQQIRGEVDGITVIDDFAHHPLRSGKLYRLCVWPGRIAVG